LKSEIPIINEFSFRRKKMRILVATDGSEFSRVAIEKCRYIIAQPSETEVKIVSVYPEVLPLDIFPQSIEYAEKHQTAEQINAERYLTEAREILGKHFLDSGIQISTETLVGSTDRQIIEKAKEWEADLIVVGSHGRGFWGRTIVGSVTDSIVHHAPCSVLVVRRPNKSQETDLREMI
jgi:nucleotide-binding universal stress UspA family protein